MARSTALAKAKTQLSNSRKSFAAFKKKAREAQVPNALMAAGGTVVGAAVGGVVDEMVDVEILGLDPSVVLALVALGVGIGAQQELPIYLAGGMVAHMVRDQAMQLARGETPDVVQSVQQAVGM